MKRREMKGMFAVEVDSHITDAKTGEVRRWRGKSHLAPYSVRSSRRFAVQRYDEMHHDFNKLQRAGLARVVPVRITWSGR